jgi:predicted Zn finger-like uncharacterized protein
MSPSTECPECSTRFRVTAEQLEAHQGIVRCGRCNSIFNATENLHDDEPCPQLNLPIAAVEMASENDPEALFNQAFEPAAEADATPAALNFLPPANTPQTLAQQVRFISADPAEIDSYATPRHWPWWLAVALLLLVLLAQVAYFLRVDIAAQLPSLKPALQRYCSLLNCTVELPRKVDLMSIESSDLEADLAPSTAITVNILLRNRAAYPQAYPALELTLTDIEDKALARRLFSPVHYLKAGEDDTQGLAGNRERSIKLHLDAGDLKAAGYRLLLLYP